eukprot:CAMPEP_0119045316 /NCGR_PEP_ID=MMETSP1177-20130426/38892_1 /TAXON_ID=2985 /ORGANISM="Ochromonas sp, Strain CCMP1899" /LENGTH=85 /DNA_ID=CAMNT_0007016871 /DNA_START=24 /DNA_END=278 /DNA_ORIENTATION=-
MDSQEVDVSTKKFAGKDLRSFKILTAKNLLATTVRLFPAYTDIRYQSDGVKTSDNNEVRNFDDNDYDDSNDNDDNDDGDDNNDDE